jgi:pyrroline-5-carboxylate reductase
MLRKKIAFLGAGSLAESLIRGLLTEGNVLAEEMYVMNRSNQERLQQLVETYGVVPFQEKREAVRQADVLVIAVKPNDVVSLLQEIAADVKENQVVVSFAAGVTIETIENQLGKNISVVRAMPNTSCAVLQSATAVSFSSGCDENAKQLAIELLSAVGTVSVIEESLMDAVTGLSGSGPAFFYYIVEAMLEAGVMLGMPEEIAKTLVVQTIYGAGCMLMKTGLPPAELRRQITSPNGTTQAGLEVLRTGEVNEWMIRAILRAAERSRELGQES